MSQHTIATGFRLGIKKKLNLLFIISIGLPFLLIGYFSYKTTAGEMTKQQLSADRQHVTNLASNLQNFLDSIPDDINFIRNLYALNRYLQWRLVGEPYKTNTWRNDTQRALVSFLDARHIYRSLQVIDLRGEELIHIEHERTNNNTQALASHLLQGDVNSQQANYNLTNMLRLKAGEIEIMPLFRQGGKIDTAQPYLLYITPLVDQNKVTQGLLVLSAYADTFLDLLRNEESQGLAGKYDYLLTTTAGEYLYTPTNRQQWQRRYYGTSLQKDVVTLYQATQGNAQGLFVDEGVIATFQSIQPVEGKESWFLIKQTQENVALAEINRFLLVYVGAILLIMVVVAWVVSRYTASLVGPLLEVTEQLKALARGQLPDKAVSVQGKDEVADIVSSASQVKLAFQGIIAQAQAIAAGNYERDVQLLSSEDQLGQAQTHMINTLRQVVRQVNAVAQGDYSVCIRPSSEQDQLGNALLHMTDTLRNVTDKNAAENWIKTGQAQLSIEMSGEKDLVSLSQSIIRFLSSYLDAQVATFYAVKTPTHGGIVEPEKMRLRLVASYAYQRRKELSHEYGLGDGLVGQAALERQAILISEVPENYIEINSSLGKTRPYHLLITPFLYESQVKGVLEFGLVRPLSANQMRFVEAALPAIGVAIHSVEANVRVRTLLQQSQTQTEELQAQSEELQAQQEELRQTNEELEERTRELERQQAAIEEKNLSLEASRIEVENKARDLELASKYKSEFLANMSHELRTPLNSMLILSQLLTTNKEGNLNEKQIEYAGTIHNAGAELLSLINDILDLSKVEAGKIELHAEDISIQDLVETIDKKFRHVAEQKSLRFEIEVGENVPTVLHTDDQRLRQILNNFLSNAFKFTSEGLVKLSITRPQGSLPSNMNPARTLAISVSDSGIGIPFEKQKVIFEAFHQADGSTSRRYGGTGLGLSISRQLAQLFGGELGLHSEAGKGSTFTFYMPEQLPGQMAAASPIARALPRLSTATAPARPAVAPISHSVSSPEQHHEDEAKHPAVFLNATAQQSLAGPQLTANEIPADDREHLQAGDKTILIIEDDLKFAIILMNLSREKNFKCLLAVDGKTGLQLAEQYQPSAIVLDVGLPQMDGWHVMELLKDNPNTRHIPVHFMSGHEEDMNARKMGAIGYLLKPVSMTDLSDAFRRIEGFIARDLRNVLILVSNLARGQEIVDLVGSKGVQPTLTTQREEAWQHLQGNTYDCIILDVDTQQGGGLAFLEQINSAERFSQIPVLIYANRELTSIEDQLVQRCEAHLTVKEIHSPERLLDEATLFLHQLEANLPKEQRSMLRMVHDKESILRGRQVLLVDDDMRNTFALTGALEERGMEVLIAQNGKEALVALEKTPNMDLVLMDIMMPEMDGYETMQRIREQARFRKLPIIALTAKAMKSDKTKCIEAGANDYLSKPIDIDKLLSLMRVWLYR